MGESSDILIVGGGIAGLSLAAAIGNRASVRLLEQENTLAYHTSARSARQMQPSYGPEPVRILTELSISLVRRIEQQIDDSLLKPRPLYWLALGDPAELQPLLASIPGLREVPASEPGRQMPILRSGLITGALLDPAAQEVNVPRLLAWYEERARTRGVAIETGTRAVELVHRTDGWAVHTADGRVYTTRLLVDAAGSWADTVAGLAGTVRRGLVPLRRTVAVLRIGAPIDPEWPMVSDAGGLIYFRPDGDHLLASPMEDIPDEPHDAKPVHEVVEEAAARTRRLITPTVEIVGSWTGLRTQSTDGVPVVGFDPALPDFFWLTGQSGYGIQTSASFGMLAAAAILDQPVEVSDEAAAAFASLSPRRLTG